MVQELRAVKVGLGGVAVNMNATGWGSGPMKIEKMLQQGAKISDIVDEAKYMTFITNNEHAVVRLANGQKALVSGGPGGIHLPANLKTIFGHTHTKVTGASFGDYRALEFYNQSKQYIFEGGMRYPIYNKTMFQ